MSRTIVGVLRGGTSSEYDASLKTGVAMLAALPEETYDTRDIFVDKSGYWHLRGVPAEPSRILSQIDVVLNGLHGGVGEDGTVQRILERHGVAYVGTRPLASALSHNKTRMMEVARAAGILVPRGITFTVQGDMTTTDMARDVFANFGPPYIVKPSNEGASRGVVIARTLLDLPSALGEVLDAFGVALVQEFIRGENAHVGVIEDFRGQELYALPPAHALRSGEYQVPSNFTDAEKHALEMSARAAHNALGLSHFSRADFALSRGKPYLLEITTLPALHEGASFPQMLEAVGSSVPEFLEHGIALARN